MKTKLVICTLALLACTTFASAAAFEGAGNYKGHGPSANGVKIRCGWQWWHTCFGISGGYIWVDDYDHVIGTIGYVANPGDDEQVPTDGQLKDCMKVGSLVAEDGEKETWYDFNCENLIYHSN